MRLKNTYIDFEKKNRDDVAVGLNISRSKSLFRFFKGLDLDPKFQGYGYGHVKGKIRVRNSAYQQ